MKIILLSLLLSFFPINVNSQNYLKDSFSTETSMRTAIPAIKTNNDSKSENNLNWLLISGIIGIFGSSFVWAYNEWQKRNTKLVSEKEARYRILIKYIRSFGNESQDVKKANDFIIELQLCWMYCPDYVIYKGNIFIACIKKNNQSETDNAKGEFVLEMRKDLIRSSKLFKLNPFKHVRTKLNATDFMDVTFSASNTEKNK